MPDAVSGTGGTPTYNSTPMLDRPDQMGKDVFLKLLVAQMKYQDPANPADSSQMMAQTATFAQVEKLELLAKQNGALLILQEHSAAGAMVGRTVTYTDTDGASVTGKVSSVRLASGTAEAVAVVDGKPIAVGRITEIATSPTGSATPAA
jgi:flagellar basal-body rod modification protein FlgD